MKFRPITSLDVSAVAALHIDSLGIDFVTALYEAIAKSEFSFGFTAVRDGKIIGFVAFT